MWILLGLLGIGMIFGFFLRKQEKIVRVVNHVVNVSIYALIFFLGLSVGINDEVMQNFGILGFHAFLLSSFAIAGSIGTLWVIQRAVLGSFHEK